MDSANKVGFDSFDYGAVNNANFNGFNSYFAADISYFYFFYDVFAFVIVVYLNYIVYDYFFYDFFSFIVGDVPFFEACVLKNASFFISI